MVMLLLCSSQIGMGLSSRSSPAGQRRGCCSQGVAGEPHVGQSLLAAGVLQTIKSKFQVVFCSCLLCESFFPSFISFSQVYRHRSHEIQHRHSPKCAQEGCTHHLVHIIPRVVDWLPQTCYMGQAVVQELGSDRETDG